MGRRKRKQGSKYSAQFGKTAKNKMRRYIKYHGTGATTIAGRTVFDRSSVPTVRVANKDRRRVPITEVVYG